jgi:predicted Zn-dependent protease with MMP-like domain
MKRRSGDDPKRHHIVQRGDMLPRRSQVTRRFQTYDQRRFELLVGQAVDSLPVVFKQLLGDVPVVAEEEPSVDDLESTGTSSGETIMGMYHGTPLTERPAGYGMTIPEKITLYRIPIQDGCETRRDIISEIQQTLVHELAHHYGLSEERLEELGWG